MSMTKSDLIGTEINRDFVLGAWTRFINEVALGRDVIDGTTRADGLTDTVGTRGLAMYFFPLYYRATMQAIDQLGHVPRNPTEWGGVSIAGFEAAKATYLREQGGSTGGGPVVPIPEPGQPLPPSDLDRIDGQLQIEAGGGFHVNGRPVLPTLCHYGDALSKWMRDRDHVRRNLDLIASVGYHGIRYWTVLDGDWWNGRHVGERFQSNYWEQHRDFLLELKSRGLVAQISQGSLTRDAVPDRQGFANRLADVLSDVGTDACALFEGVNEARDTGESDAARLADFVRVFKARHPHVLCALSAYTGTEDVGILDSFSRDPADLFVVHPYRGGGNHDKTRHLMSLRYEGKPKRRLGWNGEGPGGGNRVSAIDNRDAMTSATMCGLAAMSFMMRMAYVWFSGVGVISDDGGSQTFDQMPGFADVPKVRTLVPSDVMRYSGPIFHGGETWRNQRTFAARGEVRADHVVHSDGRQVIGIYGPGDLNVSQEKPFHAAVDHRFGSEFRLVVGRA
jgi:hypothetical protein